MSPQEKCELSSILKWGICFTYQVWSVFSCIWIWCSVICILDAFACWQGGDHKLLGFFPNLNLCYPVLWHNNVMCFMWHWAQYVEYTLHGERDVTDESKHKIPVWCWVMMVFGCWQSFTLTCEADMAWCDVINVPFATSGLELILASITFLWSSIYLQEI